MTASVGALAPSVTAGQARGIFGPIKGINTPTPVHNAAPMVIDLRGEASHFIRISATAEHLLYVFVAIRESGIYTSAFTTGFAMDFTDGVPDIIWKCTSDRILVPPSHPILLLMSASADPGEARIRRA